MPANPEAPILSHGLNIPQALLWRVGWTVAKVWLFVQAVQIGMTFIYGRMSSGSRDFMFGDYIALWDNYGDGWLSFWWSSWLKSVPMWWDWQAYAIALAFAVVLMLMGQGTRLLLMQKLSFIKWPNFTPSPAPHTEFQQGAETADGTGEPSDDFDPSRFRDDVDDDDDFSRFWKERHGNAPEPKTESEKASRLLALIQDHRTPQNEREAAERALLRLSAPPKQITDARPKR